MQLTLYIPGLRGPKARFSADYLPAVPALDLLLSRGRITDSTERSSYATLASLFGCAPEPGHDVPVGAVTHELDAGGVGRGIWMRADPVHLRADRGGVILLEAATVGLDTRDALALAAEVKPLLESPGHQLEVPCAERWYLRLARLPQLRTTELEQVAGRDIGAALPSGPEAALWGRLLNEVQMALHQSAVNEDRERRGLAPINGLWFWGAGAVPAPDPNRWTAIYGEDLFLRGLAELGGSASLAPPSGAVECLADADGNARVLAVLQSCRHAAAYQEVEAWSAAVQALEQRWFAPLVNSLRRRALDRLSLSTDGAEIEVQPRDLLCIWRRRGTLRQLAPGVVTP